MSETRRKLPSELRKEQDDRDAELGAALRAAFAEVESLHQLAIFRPIRGEIGALIEHSIAPGAVQIESDATRALAALLRSSPPEGPPE